MFKFLRGSRAPTMDHGVRGIACLHDFFEGACLLGGIGAGKTSGPGFEIADYLLRHPSRPGFLVLAARPDEYARWHKYCAATGRQGDLVRFAPQVHSCDVMSFTMSHPQATIEDGCAFMDTLTEVGSRHNSGGGGEGRFWDLGGQKDMRRAMGLVWLAGEKPSFANIYRAVTSRANTTQELQSAAWQERSYVAHLIRKGRERWGDHGSTDFNMCSNYYSSEWPAMSDRQKGVFYSIATNTLDKLLSGPVADLLSGETTITPAAITDNHAVIVVDAPIVRYGVTGQFIGVTMKLATQQHALRRDPSVENTPVVIWQDEAQLFALPEKDYEVQAVARAARLISVLLTQSIPGLHAALGGGPLAVARASSLLSNHSIKVLCANSCVETNRYCSELCGSSWQDVFGGTFSGGGEYDLVDDMFGRGMKGGPSLSWNAQYKPDLPPEEWTRLTKGGRGIVEAIAFQNGRLFDNGKVWKRVTFNQG